MASDPTNPDDRDRRQTKRVPGPSPRENTELTDLAPPVRHTDAPADEPTQPARPIEQLGWGAEPTLEVRTVARRIAGRYELGVLLGSGGFGSVFEARDPLSDRHVAIKLLGVRSERELQRFRYETTSLRLLQVPGVVRLLDDGLDEGEAYIVMERVEGAYFPGSFVPAPWSRIAQSTLGLLEALARVHAHGVMHRDLKPSNVLVDADGRVTILDLGVSALKDLAPSDRGVVGTPSYLAPEQATAAPTDARADLYTVGVMLFEALSGVLPHGRAPADAVMTAKVSRRAPPLRSVAPEVPADIAQIVDWLLEPHPADRPSSAAEVIDALLGREEPDPLRRRVDSLAAGRPLDVAALRPLFAGPDLFMHLPSDGAALAISRVGDAPAAVAHELGAWVRAGLARWENQSVTIERAALHRITALPVRQRVLPGARVLVAAERDLLAWIALAGQRVKGAEIARAAELSPQAFASLVAALEAAGVVRSAGDGYAADASLVVGAWPALRVRAAHRALYGALEPGHTARMTHATLAADAELIVNELDAFVSAAIRQGRVESARSLLCEALRVLRRDPDVVSQERALAAMAELALTEATVPAYDQLLYELGCTPHTSVELERLRKLAQAGRLSEQNDAARALALLDEVGQLETPGLELRRRACRMRAARWLPLTRYEELLEESREWGNHAPPPARAHFVAWSARQLYIVGRFVESGRAYLESAATMESAHAQIRERLNAAGAFLETYEDLDSLVVLAREVQDEAMALRDPLAEARAFWIERSARYRRGDQIDERGDAIAAAPAIGVPWMSGLLVLQEAAFAWRNNSPATRDYFARAFELFSNAGVETQRVFCRLCLGLVDDQATSGMPVLTQAIEIARRPSTPPGVAIQLAALVAMLEPSLRAAAAAAAKERVGALPVPTRAFRRELLSVDECLAYMAGD